MNDMTLKGNIRDFSLPKILTHINRQRKTGTLLVKTITLTKKVYFSKGDAIFASSSYEDDRLGEMLIKAGNITIEQYDASVKILKETKKRLGAILVELGYITPKDLFWGVKFQVREIIYSIFILEDADYEFIEGDLPTQEVITLKMSMGNLIYEGVRRIDNLTRIRREMPPAETVLRLSKDPVTLFQNVELSPQDRKMLSIVDGEKTIREIVDSAWVGSFEGMKILYVLWSIGVVEEKKRIVEKYEESEEMVSLDEILQPVPDDEHAFLGKVDEIYMNLESRNAYQLLDVEENADIDTVKKSYYRLTREFHPDRSFGTADPSLKDKLTSIFDALTDAFNEIQHGLKKLSPEASTLKSAGAEEHFRLGIEEFKKGDFRASARSFSSATDVEPQNPKYWSHLALALTKIPERLKESESALSHALKLEPNNADHYANLGMIYVMQGMKKAAFEQFQRALGIAPGNVKARKAIDKLKG
jgi:tetratricopeptide (TPR) repeat protein